MYDAVQITKYKYMFKIKNAKHEKVLPLMQSDQLQITLRWW